MIVHFAAPSPTYLENEDIYQRVYTAIHARGWRLTSCNDDEKTLFEMALPGVMDTSDFELLCQRALGYLQKCDAAIFDASNRATFGVGYQVAVALAANKPTLLLLRKGSVMGSFITGLQHPSLARAEFDDGNIEEVVGSFLEKQARESGE